RVACRKDRRAGDDVSQVLEPLSEPHLALRARRAARRLLLDVPRPERALPRARMARADRAIRAARDLAQGFLHHLGRAAHRALDRALQGGDLELRDAGLILEGLRAVERTGVAGHAAAERVLGHLAKNVFDLRRDGELLAARARRETIDHAVEHEHGKLARS